MYWPHPDESVAKCNLPGIYRFTIDGLGVYVGRFTNASRPLREYSRNVEKLLEGRPYRPKNHDGFRHVHRVLHQAVMEGRSITLEIVENVDPKMLNERERYWIKRVPDDLRLNGKRRQP